MCLSPRGREGQWLRVRVTFFRRVKAPLVSATLRLDVVNFGMLVRECGDAMKWRIGSNLFSVMQVTWTQQDTAALSLCAFKLFSCHVLFEAWSVQPNARVYGAFINSFGASNWQLLGCL